MLGFPLGILSAAGAAVVDTGAYELISSTILGGTAASVTFSNLGDYSSTYKHLQLRAVNRTTRTGVTFESLRIRLNGVSTTSYSWHTLEAEASVYSSAATSQTGMWGGYATTSVSASNAFGAEIVDVLDAYSSTKNTTIRTQYGMTNLNILGLGSGAFLNTASITSLEIFAPTTSFVAGSRFSLYGIKG
jgi:hypothetical protein